MFCVHELSRSRPCLRAAALALIALGIVGCSADSSRLNESLFSNSPSHPEPAGMPPGQAVPGHVESRPPNAQSAQLHSPAHQPGAQPLGYGGSSVRAAYTPASHTTGAAHPRTSPEVTGTIAPRPSTGGGWTWNGGTPITVAPGDTLETIARRYGVPVSAIAQANNISPPATIQAGQQLVIPRYAASSPARAMPAASRSLASKPAAMSPAGNQGAHVVAQGETLTRISRLYGRTVTEIARVNNIQVTAKLNVGDRLIIPGLRVSAAKPRSTPAATAVPVNQPKSGEVGVATTREAAPGGTVSMVSPVADPAPTGDVTKSAEAAGGLPKFRWPANGRVIAGFGPTTNGQQNDGINIALPENTPIKAAEEGVVAYAGNELKGYGNLVLVRHPSGYVTAYAHAKELLVKRGDQVKRGQPIARSGQTGNVTAPQLHFEIRKGATPLDPMKFLNGA
jgi:murein DD-endopeptidase MepM/ murein hydrolase activator NlpD